MAYYVETSNEVIYRFNNKCNYIDYSDSEYLLCFHDETDFNGSQNRTLLGMIPHRDVVYIQNVVSY